MYSHFDKYICVANQKAKVGKFRILVLLRVPDYSNVKGGTQSPSHDLFPHLSMRLSPHTIIQYSYTWMYQPSLSFSQGQNSLPYLSPRPTKNALATETTCREDDHVALVIGSVSLGQEILGSQFLEACS
jgi:hypothetical protein